MKFESLDTVFKRLMRQTADERFLADVLPIPQLTPEQCAKLYPEDARAGYELAQQLLEDLENGTSHTLEKNHG
jgi:hypothetical protein